MNFEHNSMGFITRIKLSSSVTERIPAFHCYSIPCFSLSPVESGSFFDKLLGSDPNRFRRASNNSLSIISTAILFFSLRNIANQRQSLLKRNDKIFE